MHFIINAANVLLQAMYSLVQPLLYLPTALRTLWIWKANTDIDYLPPGSLPVPCEAYPVHPVAAVLIAMYVTICLVHTAVVIIRFGAGHSLNHRHPALA